MYASYELIHNGGTFFFFYGAHDWECVFVYASRLIRAWACACASERLLIHMQTHCPIDRPSEGWNVLGTGERSRGWVTIGISTIHSTCTHYMPGTITSNQTHTQTHTSTHAHKQNRKCNNKTLQTPHKQIKGPQYAAIKNTKWLLKHRYAHNTWKYSLPHTIRRVHRCGRSILFSLTPTALCTIPGK